MRHISNVRDGYARPDLTRPLDSAATRTALLDGQMRGFHLANAAARIKELGHEPAVQGRFASFREYSGALYWDLLEQWAQVEFPHLPVREAMRRIGRRAYDDICNTAAGRVVFGVLGRDIRNVIKLTTRAFDFSGRPLTGKVLELGDNHSLVRIENAPIFIDGFHVGAFEGVLNSCGITTGAVFVKDISPHEAELYTEWS
jgi:uncharacterized protein (TIGR02265 family)